jgi:hypothetical protein
MLMAVKKDKVDVHKLIEVICPEETRGEVCTIRRNNVIQNNKRNNNGGIVREVSPSLPR